MGPLAFCLLVITLDGLSKGCCWGCQGGERGQSKANASGAEAAAGTGEL